VLSIGVLTVVQRLQGSHQQPLITHIFHELKKQITTLTQPQTNTHTYRPIHARTHQVGTTVGEPLVLHRMCSLYKECALYRCMHVIHTFTHQVGTTVGEPLMLYDGAVTGKLIEVWGLCVCARVCVGVCAYGVCGCLYHTFCVCRTHFVCVHMVCGCECICTYPRLVLYQGYIKGHALT
jgi:hypothetical protein